MSNLLSQYIHVQGQEVYQLSPMQQGVLFDSLKADRVGVDVEQILCTLCEELNLPAFEQAWQQLVDRHPVLRTSFQWECVDEPIQQVHPHITLPVDYQDWQPLSPGEQQQRLQAHLVGDRQQGFDLTQVPIMRLSVLQIAEAAYWLIWSFHHILLDGRAFVILLKEVFTIYEALCQGKEAQLSSPPAFKSYIESLQQQNHENSASYWQQLLSDFTVPTPLPGIEASSRGSREVESAESGEEKLALSAETTTALKALAKQHNITLNTLFQGAWALLLSAYSKMDDVMFGAVRACRRSVLGGGESTVGIFINNLPVRVRLAPDMPLIAWLQDLRTQHIAIRPYEHTPLSEVRRWSAVPSDVALFDSLVVFENYDLTALLQQQGGNWLRRGFQLFEKPSYPLTLTGNLGTELILRLLYDRRRFEQHTILQLLDDLQRLLESFVIHPDWCVGDLLALIAPDGLGVLANDHQALGQESSTPSTADNEVEHQLSYWRRQLAGSPDLLELPTDRPRSATQACQEAREPIQLTPDLTQALKALSQQAGTTLFTTLLTSFSVLLARYARQPEVVVGVPVIDRPSPKMEPNTLALRVPLEGNTTFTSLLSQVQQVVLSAYAHPDVPLTQLVEELKIAQHTSHHPLCQVMFALQDDAGQTLDLSGLMAPGMTAGALTTKLDLALTLTDVNDALQGGLDYNTALFDRATIQQLINHFQNLLTGILANPQQAIGAFSLLSAAERQQILVDWNATEVPYPQHLRMHDLFEAQVEATPDASAVVFARQSLSYRDLNQRANQLAHRLQHLGVKPEVTVGICIERSLEMIISLLAILKAGGAYVPLDPTYPPERLAHIQSDAQLSVVLTQTKFRPLVPDQGTPVLCVDAEWAEIATESQEKPTSPVTAENLAYIIYTSGSTGKPKGVLIEHRGAVNTILDINRRFHVIPGDRLLAVCSLNFDLSVYDVFGLLAAGGTLVLPQPAIAPDLNHWINLMQDEQVTLWNSAPPVMQLFSGYLLDVDRTLPACLRLVMMSGDWIPLTLPDQVRQLRPGDQPLDIISLGGATEASIWSILHPIHEIDPNWKSIPYGRPMFNQQFYILNEQLCPVPAGQIGELYIGGDGVARGYHNRPDLNATKFLPDPFRPQPRAQIYRTGDLGRYWPDGTIEFLGRIDHQVKIRGFRIEMGEIEVAVTAYPCVQQALIMVREDTPGEKRLVAYVTANLGETIVLENLRSALQKRLPDYMVPAAFVMLDEFPLTPNGKIDRRALPVPDLNQGRSAAIVQPRTATERAVTSIWSNLLGVEVGIHDNFFDLGGHSLLVTRIVARLREVCSVSLPITSIFQKPTPAELSTLIDDLQQQEQHQSIPPLQPILRGQNLPLSFAQERLWFLNRLTGDSATYNIPLVLRLEGDLNITALSQALQALVDRHEILRTCFQYVNSQPIQVIAPSLTITLNEIDLQSCADQVGELQRSMQTEVQHFFSLEQLPLFRVTLLRLTPTSQLLLINIHHIIADGWSMYVLTHELSECYQACLENKTSDLPALPIQYADYTLWQRQWLVGKELERQLSYWRQQLAGIPDLLELPTDFPRPAVQTFRGAKKLVHIDEELTRGLNKLSQQTGTTLFMTLLTALAILLSRYARQSDVVVGSPTANRPHPSLEPLIGFFVNTLVLRVNVEGNPTFVELLSQVQRVAIDAYNHQDVPFEKLVQELKTVRHLSHHPIFQVIFALQNTPYETLKLPELTISTIEVDTETAKFDLVLSLTEFSNGLQGSLEYNLELFEATTIDRMIGHFRTLLQGIIDNPQRPIAQLPLLTSLEQHQLITEWNNTLTDYPSDRCIHHLFEEQAVKHPDQIALVWNEQVLTYRALNQQANQLAHHLQTFDIQPGQSVGLSIPRSPALIIGILGILKAGGAYLPLDPSYPVDRLAFMMTDGEINVLVTQSSQLSQLPSITAQIICLDTDEHIIGQYPNTSPSSTVCASDLAYIMYTSGSTGRPKGVTIPHRGVVRLVKNTNYATFSPTQIFLQLAPIAFDASTLEIWGSLLNGGKLVLFPMAVPDLATLGQVLRQHQVTTLWLTSGLFHLMVDEHLEDLASLQQLLAGGDVLSVSHVQRFLQRHPHCRLINGYGPTENTTFTCCYPIVDPAQITTTVPIGRPIANTQVYILDSSLQPVPIGVPGELYTGGDGLAQGYFNRPDLTAERFIPNPFNQDKDVRKPGGEGDSSSPSDDRLYKTGDLVRYRPDGTIEFLGRIDFQVKIRGFRIELGEVEAALAKYTALEQSLVMVREDNPGDKRLVAYMVAKARQAIVPEDVRSFLQNILPGYMVPSAFVILEEFPLNPNGKVDRKALPMPSTSPISEVGTLAASDLPQNDIQRQLVEIWQEALGVQPIGIQDNFFALGGHSLMAVKLWSQVEKTFKRDLPLITLFQAPTIAELATRLRQPVTLETVLCPSLVVIQSGNSSLKPPLFCLHVLGRGLEFCRPFTQHLDPQQTVYGLSIHISDENFKSNYAEDLAQHYAQQIRTIQPEGPYLLLGISFGGIVAFETARLLTAQGLTVNLLALVDTHTCDSVKSVTPDKYVQRHWKRLYRVGPSYILRRLLKSLKGKIQWLRFWMKEIYFRLIIWLFTKFDYPLPLNMRDFLYAKRNEQSQIVYKPKFYDGDVILIKAMVTTLGANSNLFYDLGWGKWVNNVQIYEMSGTHLGMLQEPGVRVLAKQLQRYIDEAIAPQPQTPTK